MANQRTSPIRACRIRAAWGRPQRIRIRDTAHAAHTATRYRHGRDSGRRAVERGHVALCAVRLRHHASNSSNVYSFSPLPTTTRLRATLRPTGDKYGSRIAGRIESPPVQPPSPLVHQSVTGCRITTCVMRHLCLPTISAIVSAPLKRACGRFVGVFNGDVPPYRRESRPWPDRTRIFPKSPD